MVSSLTAHALQPASQNRSVRFSVLLATYNGEAYLAEQLQSIANQTHCVHQLLVCDDASTDATLTIVEQFKRTTHVPVEIISNPINMGFARNFMQGIQACKGDYIAFCDQDDVWLPHKLERIANVIGEHKVCTHNAIRMVFSDTQLVDASLTPTGQTGFQYLKLTQTDMHHMQTGKLLHVLVRKPCVTGMTMVCERLALQALPSVAWTPDMPHDYLFSTAMAANYPYAVILEPLVLYRQHANNVVGMRSGKHAASIATVQNQDLFNKKVLFDYAIQAEPCANLHQHTWQKTLMANMIKLTEKRIQDRASLWAWLEPYPMQLKWCEAIAFKLKDLRMYVRSQLARVRYTISR